MARFEDRHPARLPGVRLVFAGTPAVAIPSLERLLNSGHEVAAVVTRPDAPRGRSKRPQPSDVGAWASDHGLDVLTPAHPRDPEFLTRLAELRPDSCPVVAYGALIPQAVLDVPRHGWINLHFSLLPRWRGAAPVQRALMAGDAVTGATTFRLVPELDAGPVYGRITEPIGPLDTAGDLLARLADAGAGLLADTIDSIDAGAEPTAQTDDGVTLAPKVTPEEARIDWTRTAEEIRGLVRGCSPEPMAWTTLDAQRVKVALVGPCDGVSLAPGEVTAERRRVLVGAGDGVLELLQVQPAGKRVMAAADWARGLHAASTRLV